MMWFVAFEIFTHLFMSVGPISASPELAIGVFVTALTLVATILTVMLTTFMGHFKEVRNIVFKLSGDMVVLKNDMKWVKDDITWLKHDQIKRNGGPKSSDEYEDDYPDD